MGADQVCPECGGVVGQEGLGTALKPACEDWWLLRKPLEGTVAANVLKHGTGAINVDACRIATEESLGGGAYSGEERTRDERSRSDSSHGEVFLSSLSRGIGEFTQPPGRWPANLLHDGSPEVVAMFPDSEGQVASVGPEHGDKPSVVAFGDFGPRDDFQPRGDVGSASRFFFSGKATRADREEGLETFPPKQRDEGREADAPGANNPRNRGGEGRKNHHPTVKPTALMRWLVKLITPAGGTVLDPFCGSGSTGKACVLERRAFVGIEKDPDYAEIARARIAWAQSHLAPEQLSLLGEAI